MVRRRGSQNREFKFTVTGAHGANLESGQPVTVVRFFVDISATP